MPSHFHSPRKLRRIELGEILVLERMRQHRRAERGGIARLRLRAAAFEPGEQVLVGRAEAVPDHLDLVGLAPADERRRGLGETGGGADAQLAGDQLDERPASGLVEGVEPARDPGGEIALGGGLQALHHVGEGGDVGRRVVVAEHDPPLPDQVRDRLLRGGAGRGGRRPEQPHGLRQVADVVVRHPEQHRVDPLGDEPADDVRLGLLEHERVRHGGERPAALGVRRVGEVVREEPQLRVAPRLVHEPVEEGGEAVHERSSLRERGPRAVVCGRLAGQRLRLALVAVPEEVQRPRPNPLQPAPVHQRVLLPVRDPDLPGPGLQDGAPEIVPVAMVGDDERQLDPLLARPAAHSHPAGGEGGDGIGEAPGPQVLDRGGRAEHDRAPQRLALRRDDLRRLPEGDPLRLVELRQALQRPVDVDRAVEALLPEEGHHALGLAESVGADDVGALGEEGDGVQKLSDLLTGVRVAEHGQAEGGLRDEHVAGNALEGSAGRVGLPLVVARDHDAKAARLDRDLRGAEHVPGRDEPDRNVADPHRLAQGGLLAGGAEILAVAHGHDGERFPRRQDGAVTGAGMVGVAVGDQRLRDGAKRIDVKAAGRAVETLRA